MYFVVAVSDLSCMLDWLLLCIAAAPCLAAVNPNVNTVVDISDAC